MWLGTMVLAIIIAIAETLIGALLFLVWYAKGNVTGEWIKVPTHLLWETGAYFALWLGVLIYRLGVWIEKK